MQHPANASIVRLRVSRSKNGFALPGKTDELCVLFALPGRATVVVRGCEALRANTLTQWGSQVTYQGGRITLQEVIVFNAKLYKQSLVKLHLKWHLNSINNSIFLSNSEVKSYFQGFARVYYAVAVEIHRSETIQHRRRTPPNTGRRFCVWPI